MDFTVLSDEPTLKADPGFVTVKAPLENTQLSAVEASRIIISAVPAPNVTAATVILPFATKSLVAAKATIGTNSARIVRNFFTIAREVP